MTDKSQSLSERLRKRKTFGTMDGGLHWFMLPAPDPDCHEAASALDAKDAEIAKLQALNKTTRNTALINLKVAKDRGNLLAEAVKALEPFAKQIELIECTTDHEYFGNDGWPMDNDQVVKIGDLSFARTTLAKLKKSVG